MSKNGMRTQLPLTKYGEDDRKSPENISSDSSGRSSSEQQLSRPDHWKADTYAKTVQVAHLGHHVLQRVRFKSGNSYLDLGCGDGRNSQLVFREYTPDVTIVGVDFSQDMVDKANALFQEPANKTYAFRAYQGDAADPLLLKKDGPLRQHSFDGVISISALHWVRDAKNLAANVSEALKPGGEFVGEFAWQSPMAVRRAIVDVMQERGIPPHQTRANDPWRRSSQHEWRQLLLVNGFDRHDTHVDVVRRRQLLNGPDGMKDWLNCFAKPFFEQVPQEQHPAIVDATVERLRPSSYDKETGQWHVTYERLLVQAGYKRSQNKAVGWVTKSDRDMADSTFGNYGKSRTETFADVVTRRGAANCR